MRSVAIACLLFFFVTASAQAQIKVSSAFPSAGVLSHATFVNVYLYPYPALGSWDKYEASINNKIANSTRIHWDPAETSENIDSLTASLATSDYFNDLGQYGISPPIFGGTLPTIKSCVDAATASAIIGGTTFSYGTLESFASCEVSANKSNATAVNIIVSPDYDIEAYGQSLRSCAQHVDSAYHGFQAPLGGLPAFTAIPIQCNGNLTAVAQSLSHEMVEALSDPAGAGFIDVNVLTSCNFLANPGGCINLLFDRGELADICESGPANPKEVFSIAFVPFNGATFGGEAVNVSTYWSNAANSCVPASATAAAQQVTPPPPPKPTAAEIKTCDTAESSLASATKFGESIPSATLVQTENTLQQCVAWNVFTQLQVNSWLSAYGNKSSGPQH